MTTEPTIFNCLEQQGGWATFAQKGNHTSTVPIISWKTLEFGEKWTPKNRCFHVSKKLTDTVAGNGGLLFDLYLTSGKVVTGQTVICVVNANQENCDLQNMLFTLNQENAKNPSLTIDRMTNFAMGKGANNTVFETGIPEFVSLEDLVTRSLQKKVVY